MPTRYGEFEIRGYINKINGEHHVVLTKGDISDGEPVLCQGATADSSMTRL